MAYTPHTPPPAESPDQLRARIPGWGVDLDPADRPSVPRLQFRDDLTGASWEFPERQVEHRPRERSMEHASLTPVFGTAQPTAGLSGRLRRLSYRRYSEARAAHWLLLIAADRVDVLESRVGALLRGRPDRLVRETGVRSELTAGGLRSRRGRSDVRHQVLDPVVVAGPWLATAAVVVAVRRARARR